MTADLQLGIPLGSDGRDSRISPLILTLFGLYARGERNWLSVASVVKLIGDLGYEVQAVRSSVSRLKRRSILCSERLDGAAGYSLEESVLETLAEGDVRIFERKRAAVEDGWVVAVFSVPETERDKRHALRTTLTNLGFGTVSPGVWVAPVQLAAEVRRILERRELSAYVDLFTGPYIAFGNLRSKVRGWWDLQELTQMYGEFLQRYQPVLDQVTARRPTPQEAFQVYVPMLTQWRRMPYRDPGLPLALLPPDWYGVSAETTFRELNSALSVPAGEYARAVIHGTK
ncbi:PaaX family transcriptional regulator C-terminal domain-containing protein [Streptomyces sp. NPDC051217]|uniref:PaaX family transcriptional regulator n=1 Tax=Streptomyces sp. NPDC051217 TaxID=3365644 RepID=UPI00378A1133